MSRDIGSMRTDTSGQFGYGQVTLWLLSVALLVLEGGIGFMLLALYKKGSTPWDVYLLTNAGFVFLICCVVAGMSVTYLLYRWHLGYSGPEFRLTAAMNLITLFVMAGAGEIIIRGVAASTSDGETIRGMVLLPKDWDKAKRYYGQLSVSSRPDLSYLAYEPTLGWTVGADRTNSSGLYRSGSAGVRVDEAGKSVRPIPGKRLVALIGDSFTFGEEVTYKDTWGAHLEKLLGTEYQVVNFGVPGYGVDQAYLRYDSEVKNWKPDVVVLGFISHDLLRSMTVYTFLNFTEWGFPFSKPRFVISNTGLERLNVPALPPEQIFAHSQVDELPFLGYDPGYQALQWNHSAMHHSYLIRFFVSRFPRWEMGNKYSTEPAMLELNERILSAFIRDVTNNGSLPLLAYFPSHEDFRKIDEESLGRRLLKRMGQDYMDPLSCLERVRMEDRFVAGNGHYSPQGNAAVAQCFAEIIRREVSRVPIGAPPRSHDML